MAKRRGSLLLWGLFAAVFLLAHQGSASVLPKGTKLNPRTGRPIVTRGTGRTYSKSELVELCRARGFAQPEKMASIGIRESGGDPGIVLDTRGMTRDELLAYWGKPAREELSVGFFQVNLLANAALVPGDTLEEKVRALQSPSVSVDVAYSLSRGGTSFGPWGG